MLAIERQKRILEAARRERTVRTQELAAVFKVTEETVRRDLDALSRRGLLRRTHGGATDVSIMPDELSQSDRETRQANEKRIIAKLAAKHVEDHETIMLDASSTALEFAGHLPTGKNLRVVTYALTVVEKLSNRSDIEIVLLGGIYEPKGRRFRGMLTEMGMRALRIDRFFFSGGGFHGTCGIGEPNAEEARIKAAIIPHAEWKCLIIDHTKLGRLTDHFFAQPSEIDLVITDSAEADFFKSTALAGMRVETA